MFMLSMVGMATEEKTRSKKMKKSFDDLSVYNSKAGKRYLPVDNLAEYSGQGEGIFAELGMAGLVRKHNHEGFKIRIPAKLFTTSKFGRFMWVSRKSDFEGSGRDIQEAKPIFGLTSEGAKELLRLHALRFENNAEAASEGQLEGGVK